MSDMDWDIIGHHWAAAMLQQHIAGGMMRHAYLFSGPTGVGRRTLALRFAQAVNCTQPPSPGFACGKCRVCKQIEKMQHADLTVIQSGDEGAILKVEQVRKLQHELSLAPFEGGYRIALLLRFEEANENAQNALLKTLEEPNPKVLLILTADDPENLLPTITSRCEVLRLRPLAIDDLVNELEVHEGLSKDKAELIAHVSSGRVGFAKKLAGDENLLENRQKWLDDLQMLLGANRAERFNYSQKATKSGKKDRSETKQALWKGLTYWLSFWRDVMLVNTGSGIAIANIDMADVVQSTASKISGQDAVDTVRALEQTFIRIRHANLKLMLDTLLLDWPVIHMDQVN